MNKSKKINQRKPIDTGYFERTWLDDVLSSIGNKVPLTPDAMAGTFLKDHWSNPSK